jgi:ABC-type Zn2+ transport system substrate-binding protein/surface adhesin
MEHKAVTDVATGSFRLRKSDQHATSSTIVDMDNDELIALTTVEVSDGVVLLHCLDSSMAAQEEAEDEGDTESEEEESEEEGSDEEEKEEGEEDDEEEDEEDEDNAHHGPKGRTYTVASGNSMTVRAAVIRLEPVGKQTAEGTYRVHVLQLAS